MQKTNKPTRHNFRLKPMLALLTSLQLGLMSVQAQESNVPTPPAEQPQVVAKVNGVEITRREVDYLYSLNATPNLPPDVAANMKRNILVELVRAEALAQKAKEMKLDAKADLELETQLAERRSLASRAEREFMRGTQRVTEQTAFDFVNKNPHMFAERRLLTIDELHFNSSQDGLLDKIDQATENGAGIEKLEDQIRMAKGRSSRRTFQVSTDQLDRGFVVPMTAKPPKPVVVKFNQDTQGGVVLFVRSSVAAPITGREAIRAAMVALNSRQVQATRLQGMQSVLKSAKVDYFGEYAAGAMPAVVMAGNLMPEGGFVQPSLSRNRKIALAAGFGVASTLSILLLITGWHYWTGPARRDAKTGAGGFKALLRKVPVVGKLMPEVAHAEALSEALASSSSSKEGAAWYGKLLLLLGFAACAGAGSYQVASAWKHLPGWVLGTAGAGGFAAGIMLVWLYLRLRRNDSSRSRRWIPAAVSGLLLLGTSAASFVIA
jgi:EpsD family peptidyl-prolyl cis-trans isomerase